MWSCELVLKGHIFVLNIYVAGDELMYDNDDLAEEASQATKDTAKPVEPQPRCGAREQV
jgi:hypothetical protein